jgi:chorismate mutase / prephenate dehydratase
MNLDDLRKQVDGLDGDIVRLIAERMKVTKKIGEQKREMGKAIEDKAREQIVIDKVKNLARNENLSPEEIEKIYQRIFIASKEVQGITVAFQGEPGAYSEEAAFQYFGPGSRLKPCESLEGVFQAVETSQIQYGLVPVENSLEGMVARTYDLLLDSNLMICGETQLRVVHCLIGLPESHLDSIKEVYSHPQALGQCKGFLNKMGWKPIPAYDTAGSVKIVKECGARDKAAIASARSAEIYGMKILVRGIEDNNQNFTKFFVLSRQESGPTGDDMTSIVFSVKHKPGALYDAIKELAARNINLTKIESRPTRQKPWEYNFYVDFEGNCQDTRIKEALKDLENSAIFVKVLGSYPKNKRN